MRLENHTHSQLQASFYKHLIPLAESVWFALKLQPQIKSLGFSFIAHWNLQSRPRCLGCFAHALHLRSSIFYSCQKNPAVVYECAALKFKKGVVAFAPYGRPCSVEVSKTVIEPLAIAEAFSIELYSAIMLDASPGEALLKSCYQEELAVLYFLF